MKNLKKYRVYFFLFIILTSIVAAKLLIKPSEIIIKDNTFGRITPGETSQKSLEKTLGQPIKKDVSDQNEVYYYQTSKPNWANLFYIDNEQKKVSLIKNHDVDPSENYQSFIARFGPADHELYGTDFINGFSLHAFLEKGVAFLANATSGSILEIWYFTPTDIDQFLLAYGQGYSLTPPDQSNQF